MLPMYSKCPTKRRWRIHQANILPGRGAFRCTDPLNHAWRATLAMHDGSHRTNLATLDGSRWTNPATLDGFTGRIRPCLMASPDESYRARWFLSCKSCHPALAAPVGQSTLDGANGFHRRVRHCHFRECPLKKHLNNCGARLHGAQSAAAPVSWGPIRRDVSASQGPIRPESQSQSARAISALEPQYAAEPQLRNAKAASAPDIKAPSPFQLLEPKAHKPKTISPNHQGKAQSSLAFSRRHFEGWQPRFQWDRIQQLPLHRAPGAYQRVPTQEPSRE